MKKSIFYLVKLLLLFSFILDADTKLHAQNKFDFSELTLEQLMNIEVITASRDSSSVVAAPSVVTVITAGQMEQQGLKTVEEVLQRVVGFSTPHFAAQAQIVSRGIIQDQNINYLLLIDGHVQNSITVYGMDNQHIYPFVNNIDRIEVIRGPGSTLWGTDALSGIINIITKTGASEDTKNKSFGSIKSSYDYQFRDQRKTAYLQYAKKFNTNFDVLLSYVNTRSEGDILPQYFARLGPPDSTEPVVHPSGIRVDGYRNWPTTQEAYLNAHIGDFRILARLSDQHVVGGQETFRDGHLKSNRAWQQRWIDGVYTKKITPSFDIETRLFYDYIKQDRNIPDDPNTAINDGYYARNVLEEGVGAELLSHYKITNFNLTTGARMSYRQAQAGIKVLPDGSTSLLNSLRGLDKTLAVFGEGKYSIPKKVSFIAGLRLDKNTLRDTKLAVLPRLAVISMFSESWAFKYAFNSGLMRPTLGYMASGAGIADVGGFIGIGTNKSTYLYSNDFQVNYSRPKFNITNTVYYTYIKNLTTFVNTNPDNIIYGSLSPIRSYGEELEIDYQLKKGIRAYGNFAYSYSRFDKGTSISSTLPYQVDFQPQDLSYNMYMKQDRTVMGVPRLTWNLGVNSQFSKDISLNIHYRGWAVSWQRWTNRIDDFHKFGPGNFLDFNLLYKNCILKGMDISVYGKNITDNKVNYPTFNAGYIATYGIAIGTSVVYSF